MAISSKPLRLAAGDLVRIRSGSPNMTAARVDYQVQRPYARCIWFDPRGKFQFVSMDIDALELVDPDERQPNS